MIIEDSKKGEKRLVHDNDINIRKKYYKIFIKQSKKKTNYNNLSKTQSYFNIKIRKLYFFLYMIVSFINLYLLTCKISNENIQSKLTEVTLKVKGSGNIKLFSDVFLRKYNHCEVYLNDSLIGTKINEYNINSNEIGAEIERFDYGIKFSI